MQRMQALQRDSEAKLSWGHLVSTVHRIAEMCHTLMQRMQAPQRNSEAKLLWGTWFQLCFALQK